MIKKNEIVVDNFAGGGGASTGMELGLNRHVDIAINHDPAAIDMHKVNHPETKHYCESVWDVDPIEVCQGRPVGLAWFSPDCKHFSKAKGGKPVEQNIRGLAWVAVRWAALVPVRLFMLENVEEFMTWGPLVETIPGQFKPCPDRKSETFNAFISVLTTGLAHDHPAWPEIKQALGDDFPHYDKLINGLGYQVDFKTLHACDYGAPTTRKRLFLVARNDGEAIEWPKKTHGIGRGQIPYRTAADIIDWSLPVKSIFDRKRPLAENTMKRIANGLNKFVFGCESPFVIPAENTILPFITEHANASSQRNMPADEPLRTICAQVKGGHFALVAPIIDRQFGKSKCNSVDEPLGTITAGGMGKSALVSPMLMKYYGAKSPNEYRGHGVHEPLHTLTTENRYALVSAYIAKHYTGVDGSSMADPLHTVTTKDHNALVTSHMIKMRGDNLGHPTNEPVHTISAGGNHIGEVRAFMIKYYGTNIGHSIKEPLQTVTTKHRFGLVTVHGEDYQIIDIGMRMLQPHELFAAQGFPNDYVISHNSEGKKLTKQSQVARCGNTVCPPVAQALVAANFSTEKQRKAA